MAIPSEILEAILKNKDNFDNSSRQAAAIWCKENNFDDRARFIKLQLSHAILSYNPNANTVALDTEISFLLQYHKKSFIQFDELEELVDSYTYHRGFVEQITISGEKFLDNSEKLFSLAPIYHLNLTNISKLSERLFNSSYLNNIISLSLEKNNLTDDHILQLANSPYLKNLRWLSLMSNKVDLEGAVALASSKNLENLRYVNFFDNIVDPTEYQAVDQGVILEHILPEAGEELEKRCGYVRWLHSTAMLERDIYPNRFIM